MINMSEILKDLIESRRNYTKNAAEIQNIIDEILSGVSNIISQEAQHEISLIVEPSEDNSNEYVIRLAVAGSDKKTLVAKYILSAAGAYPVIIKYNQVIDYADDKEALQDILLDMIREKINPLIDTAIRLTTEIA